MTVYIESAYLQPSLVIGYMPDSCHMDEHGNLEGGKFVPYIVFIMEKTQ
jgi:hypothetical protein